MFERKNYKHYFTFIPVLLLLIGCGNSSHLATAPTRSYNIQYALPETELRIEFALARTIFIPGPYAEFADEYLSLPKVKKEEYTHWEILNISTDLINAPNEKSIFKLKDIDGIQFEKYVEFSKYGLLSEPYKSLNDSGSFYYTPYNDTQLHFTDLSVKRNYDKVSKKSQRDINTFSNNGDLMGAKTIQQKAEEAANFIIKTRKRRFKLIAGQYEFLPTGDALAISVDELNKIEKKYVELFIGKTYTDTIQFVTYHYPQEQVKEEYQNIAYYSESQGMSAEWIEGSVPIELKMKNLSYIDTPDFQPNQVNTLYYRNPAKASLMLLLNNKSIFEQRIEVYQYAPVKTFQLNPEN